MIQLLRKECSDFFLKKSLVFGIMRHEAKVKNIGGGLQLQICSKGDIEKIMQFIDSEWAKGHILGNNFKVIHWHYYNERYDNYNFVIAKSDDGKIWGILGYIPNYRYDVAIGGKFLYTALWVVKPGSSARTLGIKLLYALQEFEATKNIATIGINPQSTSIYKMLKFKIGFMDHAFVGNTYMEDYHLIGNYQPDNCELKPDAAKDVKLIDLPEDQFKSFFLKISSITVDQLPEKTSDYFICKYFRNPFYSYHAFGIIKDDEAKAVMIYRLAVHSGHTALRVAEIIGSTVDVPNIQGSLINLLQHHNAEYIDVYSHGVPISEFMNMGFTPHMVEDHIIIPNYFEPFVRKNVAIGYAYHASISSHAGYRIYKGDGDQERPNIIEN